MLCGILLRLSWNLVEYNNKSSPVTGLDRPRVFQEVKVPRFRDNGTERW